MEAEKKCCGTCAWWISPKPEDVTEKGKCNCSDSNHHRKWRHPTKNWCQEHTTLEIKVDMIYSINV